MDGLDMALCEMDESSRTLAGQILAATTIPFDQGWFDALSRAPSISGFDLMKLDAEFGKWIGSEISAWMKKYDFKADYIASHGHTVFHEPSLGFSTQIGSGAHIASMTGLDTITSFRGADVAAGGQGAPFAPAVDMALFPGYEGYLNLGGIANVNLLSIHGSWKAWDIGPCNQVLNFLARRLGMAYDKNGLVASKGKVIPSLVDDLMDMYPFKGGQPMGLSNLVVKTSWINFMDTASESIVDLLASVTDAIARMISNHITSLVSRPAKILVTGGGAHNAHLVRRLTEISGHEEVTFHLPSDLIIDYKECLLMAYLGFMTKHDRPYGIHPVTGASHDTIGGALHRAC